MNVELIGADHVQVLDLTDLAALVPAGRTGAPITVDEAEAVFRVSDTVWILRALPPARLQLLEGSLPPAELFAVLTDILGALRARWGQGIGARITGSSHPAPSRHHPVLTNEPDYVGALRREISDGDDSFIVLLRTEGRWHHGAYQRLTRAVRCYLSARTYDEPIPLWIADLVWALAYVTADWSRDNPGKLTQQVEDTHLLAHAVFSGAPPEPARADPDAAG